jgi:hypothetical protein
MFLHTPATDMVLVQLTEGSFNPLDFFSTEDACKISSSSKTCLSPNRISRLIFCVEISERLTDPDIKRAG